MPSTETKIKLKGQMINNACTDPRECWEPGNDLYLGIYQYENLYIHGYYTEQEYDQIKGACTLGYHSEACEDIRKVMDKKFYDTNSSMLNLYAKCLYQRVPGVEKGQKHVRWVHGKVPLTDDGLSCEDMYGILKYFNEGTVQANLHVNPKKF